MQSRINFISDWSNAVHGERNRIVFENKNKSYGAFVIRNSYERNLILALLLAFVFFTGVLSLPGIFSKPAVLIGSVITKDSVPLTILHPDIVVHKDIIITPPVSHPAIKGNMNNLNFVATLMPDKDTMDDNKDEKYGDKTATADSKGDDNGSKNVTVGLEDKHEVVDVNAIIKYASVMPVFPGGEDAMRGFLSKQLHFPDICRQNEIEGTVYLTFVVDKDGSIGDIQVLRGVNRYLNEEAIRVVKYMPRWSPGLQNDKPVRVQLNLPVKFKLDRR